MTNPFIKTAAALIIGDEILSGRTQDVNIRTLANWLGVRGVRLTEVRIVADDEHAISNHINALRDIFDYVFTTGGIGPTHDDITADSVAAAFGVSISERADAVQLLTDRYGDEALNPARRRMARIPEGAVLIDNPVSTAPGFQLENVFVLAGVPKIMSAMLETLDDRIEGGAVLLSRAVSAYVPESELADALLKIQEQFEGVSLGSYPFMKEVSDTVSGRSRFLGVTIIARGVDEILVEQAVAMVAEAMRADGHEPEFRDWRAGEEA